jgi:hypothetical protein
VRRRFACCQRSPALRSSLRDPGQSVSGVPGVLSGDVVVPFALGIVGASLHETLLIRPQETLGIGATPIYLGAGRWRLVLDTPLPPGANVSLRARACTANSLWTPPLPISCARLPTAAPVGAAPNRTAGPSSNASAQPQLTLAVAEEPASAPWRAALWQAAAAAAAAVLLVLLLYVVFRCVADALCAWVWALARRCAT